MVLKMQPRPLGYQVGVHDSVHQGVAALLRGLHHSPRSN